MAYNPASDSNCIGWWKLSESRFNLDDSDNAKVLNEWSGIGGDPQLQPVAAANRGDSTVSLYSTTYMYTTGDYISTANSFSVCIRAKLDSTWSGNICSMWTGGSDNCWKISESSGGIGRIITFTISHVGGTGDISSASTVVGVTSNAWCYIAVTWDQTNKAYRIRTWDETTETIENITGAFSDDIASGKDPTFEFGRNGGDFDEISVFSEVFTAANIDNLRLLVDEPTDYASLNVSFIFDAAGIYYDYSTYTNSCDYTNVHVSLCTWDTTNFYINDIVTPKIGTYHLRGTGGTTPNFRITNSSLPAYWPFLYTGSKDQMSICMWLYPTASPAATKTITSLVGTSTYAPWKLTLNTSDFFQFIILYGIVDYETVTYTASLTMNQWYHIAVTFDDSTGAYRIRVWDPVTASELDTDVTGIMTNSILKQTGDYFNLAQGFNGYTNDYVMFNRILTVAEIDEIRAQTYEVILDTTAPTINFSVASEDKITTLRVLSDPPKEQVTETLGWLTDILKPKYSDDEQRIALRTIPRQGFRFSYILNTRARRGQALSFFKKYAKRQWGIPIWTERVKHTTALAAGAGSITVDTTYADFRATSFGLVWKDETSWEILRITSKNDTSLTLATNLVNTYTGTKFIMPLRLGYLKGMPKVTAMKNTLTEMEVEFEVHENAAVSGYSAAQTYDGLEVMTRGPSIESKEGIVETINPDILYQDNKTGLLGIERRNDYNIPMQEHSFHFKTKANIWDFRQWLHSVYGRQKTFLVPTYNQDFTLSRSVDSGDSIVYVNNEELSAHLSGYELLQYAGFLNSDGTVTVRKVLAIANVSTAEESITFTTTVGTSYATSTTMMYVWRCRLGSDSLSLDWYELNSLRCKTGFIRVTQ